MVAVITTVRRMEHLPLQLLVFDSIRTGFPTEPITVIENGSLPEAVPTIEDAVNRVGGTLRRLPCTMGHDALLERILAEAQGRVVIVDPDVIFYSKVEDWDFGDALMAGAHQPDTTVDGIRYLERLHTCFLWFPDVQRLRDELARVAKDRIYPPSFIASEMKIDGQRVIADTGHQIYAAIRSKTAAFSPEQLDCFSHVGFSTRPDLLGLVGAHYGGVTGEAHALATTDPERLRGLWRFKQLPNVEWDYFSGEVNGYGVMRTEFRDLVRGEKRVHAAISDPSTGRYHSWVGLDDADDPCPVHIRLSEPCSMADMGVRKAKGGGWSRNRSNPTAKCDVRAALGGVSIAVDGVSLWYDQEIAHLSTAEWLWVSFRLADGSFYVVYDTGEERVALNALTRERVAWESTDEYHHTVDGRPLTLVPSVPGQRISDIVTGWRYREEHCRVAEGGIAFLEIAEPRGELDWEALLLHRCNGNAEAAKTLRLLAILCQLGDDIADGDLRGSAAVADALAGAAMGLERLPFWRENKAVIEPVLLVVLQMWACSDDWRKSRDPRTRMFAYTWRESYFLLVCLFGFLTGGGPKAARKALKEGHLFNRQHAEDFAEWTRELEAEHGIRQG